MFKHELKAACTSYDPTTGHIEIETSVPGLAGTTVAMTVTGQYIENLQNKPIIKMTQAEIAMYLLWDRHERNPQKMVGHSFSF